MITDFPWVAPALSWVIVIVLLSLVMVAAFTTRRVTHNDYLSTLIASLMLAFAGTTTAMLTIFPRGTFDMDVIGLWLAALRGVASILYLAVLLHMLNVAPRIVRKVDEAFDTFMHLFVRSRKPGR